MGAPALLLLLTAAVGCALPGARGFTAARGTCRPVVCALHHAAASSGAALVPRPLDKREYKRAFQVPNHPDKGGELETSQFFNACGRELFGSGAEAAAVVSCSSGSGVDYGRIDRRGVVRAYEAEQQRNAARRAAKDKPAAPAQEKAAAAAAAGSAGSWWSRVRLPRSRAAARREAAEAAAEAAEAAARAEAEMAAEITREVLEQAAAAARRAARREREAANKAAAAERRRATAAAEEESRAAAAAAAALRWDLLQHCAMIAASALFAACAYRRLTAPAPAAATSDDAVGAHGAGGGAAACEAAAQHEEFLDEEDHMYALWLEELARRATAARRAAPAEFPTGRRGPPLCQLCWSKKKAWITTSTGAANSVGKRNNEHWCCQQRFGRS
jgi:hypothetical protein